MSELSSFVSEVGSSSAEGENEVSRERFAIFHEIVESITLEETILLSPVLMFQRSDFIIRPWVQSGDLSVVKRCERHRNIH